MPTCQQHGSIGVCLPDPVPPEKVVAQVAASAASSVDEYIGQAGTVGFALIGVVLAVFAVLGVIRLLQHSAEQREEAALAAAAEQAAAEADEADSLAASHAAPEYSESSADLSAESERLASPADYAMPPDFLECPSCGGQVSDDIESDVVTCDHCGLEFSSQG